MKNFSKDRTDTFLPLASAASNKKNAQDYDIILVGGDAYVDHASYGTAVIGRVLENAGYKVGIIAQPNWRSLDDFVALGKPRLFFGVSAGNLDSMVANYTANKKLRASDDYSPGGLAGLRPDRATIVYANRIKEAFDSTCIVLGGIEASLRRFAHYDWWDEGVRRSILLDTRADILVYGMAERQVLEIAHRLEKKSDLFGIRGTCIIKQDLSGLDNSLIIPSYEEVSHDKEKFNQAFSLIYLNQDPFKAKVLAQKHNSRYVIQYPPPKPLRQDQLDRIFALPYVRQWHPAYNKKGGIPGFETVRFSIISHRGCLGECSFCALYMHQGRIIQTRSKESIIKEAKLISQQSSFKGTITDVGGPTANFTSSSCARWLNEGACAQKQCINPKKCKELDLGYDRSLALYEEILKLPQIKHLFIESGFRCDLLIDESSQFFLEKLCQRYISGQMKVAPEHCSEHTLNIMNKPSFNTYEEFVRRFMRLKNKLKKDLYLVNYFISAHPGSGLEDALLLALYLAKHRIRPQQIQDFIPQPLTLSACIFYTEHHPFSGEKIYAPKTFRERKMQRALIQYYNPKNKKLILEALHILGKEYLKDKLLAHSNET